MIQIDNTVSQYLPNFFKQNVIVQNELQNNRILLNIQNYQIMREHLTQNQHQFTIRYSNKITTRQLKFDYILKIKPNPLQIFQNFHSDTIQTMSLKSNNIHDVTPLLKLKLPNLNGIWLRFNKISHLTTIRLLPFPKLTRIFLDSNRICSIKQLIKFEFPHLKQLNLENNHISDITPLAKVSLPALQQLNINRNYINDIQPIKKMDFPKLESIRLVNEITNNQIIIKFIHKKIRFQIYFDQEKFIAKF